MDCPDGWPLFHEYEDEIRTKNRFFLSSKFERLFLRIVNNKSNISILSPQEPLFRARVNKPDGQFAKSISCQASATTVLPGEASEIKKAKIEKEKIKNTTIMSYSTMMIWFMQRQTAIRLPGLNMKSRIMEK